MSVEQLKVVVEPGNDPVELRRSLDTEIYVASKSKILIVEPRHTIPPRLLKQVFQCLLVLALACGSYWFFSQHVLQTVEVMGASMSPTLKNSEHYLMDRWTYLIREPQPNDIVVIRDPKDSKLAVKRIIGREGDSVSLKDGRVVLNGRVLDEPYLPRNTRTFSYQTAKGDEWVVCGQGQYFVLGDNRSNSEDSRVYGPISRRNIIGMIMR
jgi:signal peptidase I